MLLGWKAPRGERVNGFIRTSTFISFYSFYQLETKHWLNDLDQNSVPPLRREFSLVPKKVLDRGVLLILKSTNHKLGRIRPLYWSVSFLLISESTNHKLGRIRPLYWSVFSLLLSKVQTTNWAEYGLPIGQLSSSSEYIRARVLSENSFQ